MVAKILLKAGSNIKYKNQQGKTVLISATQEGHIDINELKCHILILQWCKNRICLLIHNTNMDFVVAC